MYFLTTFQNKSLILYLHHRLIPSDKYQPNTISESFVGVGWNNTQQNMQNKTRNFYVKIYCDDDVNSRTDSSQLFYLTKHKNNTSEDRNLFVVDVEHFYIQISTTLQVSQIEIQCRTFNVCQSFNLQQFITVVCVFLDVGRKISDYF